MAEIVCPYCGMLNYTFSGECQNCHRPLVPPENRSTQPDRPGTPHVSPFGGEDNSSGEEPEWMKVIRQRRETEDGGPSSPLGVPTPTESSGQNDDDWLNQIRNVSPEPEESEPEDQTEKDWLKSVRDRMAEDGIEVEPNQSVIGSGMTSYLDPYWLKKLHDSHKEELGDFAGPPKTSSDEVLPDWLANPANFDTPDQNQSNEKPNQPVQPDRGSERTDSSYYNMTTGLPPVEDMRSEFVDHQPLAEKDETPEIDPGATQPLPSLDDEFPPSEISAGEDFPAIPSEEPPAEGLVQPNRSVIGSGMTSYLDPFWLKKLEESHNKKLEESKSSESAPAEESGPSDFFSKTTYLASEATPPPAELEKPEPPVQNIPFKPGELEPPKAVEQTDLFAMPSFLKPEQENPPEEPVHPEYYARTMFLDPDKLNPPKEEGSSAKPSAFKPEEPHPAAGIEQPDVSTLSSFIKSEETKPPRGIEPSDLYDMPSFLKSEAEPPAGEPANPEYYARTMFLNPDKLNPPQEVKKPAEPQPSKEAGQPDLSSLASFIKSEEVKPSQEAEASGLFDMPSFLKSAEETPPAEPSNPEYYAKTTFLNPEKLNPPVEPEKPVEESNGWDVTHTLPPPPSEEPAAQPEPLSEDFFKNLDFLNETPSAQENKETVNPFEGFSAETVEKPAEEPVSGPTEPALPFDFSLNETPAGEQTPFNFNEGEQNPFNAPAQETPKSNEDWLADFRAKSEAPASPEKTEEINIPFVFPDQPSWTDQQEAAAAPPAEAEEASLMPAELPGWVQAMRPTDNTARPFTPPAVVARRPEEQSPLSGIEGILPSEPVSEEYPEGPSYSANLNLTDKQRAQADLFRKMLAARTMPYKIGKETAGGYSRVIRWVVSGILLLAVILVTFYGSGAFGSPAYYPRESLASYQVLNDLPAGSNLLIAMDYSTAYSGEIESAVLPAINMLYHNGDHLVFLSTSPSGPALADEMMAQIISSGAYPNLKTSDQIFNLGYMPGGPAALLGIAKDLRGTAPNLANGQSAWQNSSLVNIKSVSDFSAILLLTDSAESARSWAEQVLPSTAKAKLIVATSTQAAPFIRPFYESGQLSGLITGLEGGITLEKLTGTIQKAGLHWGVYEASILIVMILVVAGIILNLSIDRIFPSGPRKKV
jgi:hypothetical protein